jgi:hypothetical protein
MTITLEKASQSVDMSEMLNYFGKLDLRKDIDLNTLRKRNDATRILKQFQNICR